MSSTETIALDSRRTQVARVWDIFVRLFHWSLAVSFIFAFFSHHVLSDLHQLAGNIAASLVAMRLVWGFIGTPYARFAQFVRGPFAVFAYLRDIVSGREARYIGHNPAGGAMVLVLLATLCATAYSGWLMTTDRYFAVDWVQELHSTLAHGLLILVLAHLAGVALASLRHRENLVRAMITGVKRKAAEDDIA